MITADHTSISPAIVCLRVLGPCEPSSLVSDLWARRCAYVLRKPGKKLPLHRSSLEYRLEKIAKMLGVDLTLPERQLELWLALRLRQVCALSIPARPGDIIARGSLPSRVGTETRPVTDS